ncbi:MAG: hypothetical protein QGM48_11065, partial [Actinomycetota bacterium]|nr:hypothetical protein [Actinomycetota bacterium]
GLVDVGSGHRSGRNSDSYYARVLWRPNLQKASFPSLRALRVRPRPKSDGECLLKAWEHAPVGAEHVASMRG